VFLAVTVSKRNSDVFIDDIHKAIQRIKTFKQGLNSEDELRDDELRQSAIVKQLEIIGEAASNVNNAVQDNHPDVPWQDLKDFRNVTTHQYWEIDVTIVWDVIENKIPELEHDLPRND